MPINFRHRIAPNILSAIQPIFTCHKLEINETDHEQFFEILDHHFIGDQQDVLEQFRNWKLTKVLETSLDLVRMNYNLEEIYNSGKLPGSAFSAAKQEEII
jgi:hypothetical protein